MAKDLYKLHVSPDLRAITDGARITFFLGQRYTTISAAGGPRDIPRWYCRIENLDGKTRTLRGPAYTFQWEKTEWETEAFNHVFCHVTYTDGTKESFWHRQWVAPAEAILSPEIDRQKRAGLHDPRATLSVVMRYIEVLVKAESQYPIKDAKQKEEHDQKLEQLREYRDKLSERIDSTNNKPRFPVIAAHIERTTQGKTEPRLFIAKVGSEAAREELIDLDRRGWRKKQIPAKQTWELVDWTNPSKRNLTGSYTGTGETDEAAIRDALAAWDAHNRYPDGVMMYEVHQDACGKVIKGQFSTDGKARWDSIAQFFEWVGLGAAVVAGIVTLVIPEPGSKVVSAMIWTSIFSSTAAAVINIGQRWDEGFHNWKDDAIDGLTIVGNIFTAGQLRWVRHADVIVDTTRAGAAANKSSAVKYALIGQIGTDSAQGILIAADHISKYEKIMKDSSMTPEDRTKALLELFRSLTIDGLMIYISVKGTKTDLDNINAKHFDEKKWKQLQAPYDPSKPPVDLTEPVKVEAHTKEKKHVTTAQEEPQRQQGQAHKTTPPPVVKPKPKHTNGIPKEVLQEDGKFLVLGMYNKDPSMAAWIKESGAKDAKLVTDYPNPLYKSGQQPSYIEPPEGFYTDVKKLSIAAIKWTTKLEGRAILFDMNGIDINKAFKPGLDAKVYDAVSSHELRYIRDHWDDFTPPPRFFENGKEVARPW